MKYMLAGFAAVVFLVLPGSTSAGHKAVYPISFKVMVHGPARVVPEKAYTWTILVPNTGTASLPRSRVEYWLTKGSKILKASTRPYRLKSQKNGNRSAVWSFGTIKPGQTRQVKVRSVVPPVSQWSLKNYCPPVAFFTRTTVPIEQDAYYKCAKYSPGV